MKTLVPTFKKITFFVIPVLVAIIAVLVVKYAIYEINLFHINWMN